MPDDTAAIAEPASPMRGLLCAFAAAAIAFAVEQRDGAFEPTALAALAASLIALSLAALAPRGLDRVAFGGSRDLATPVLAALVFLQFLMQFARPPGIELRPIAGGPWPFWGGVLFAAVLTALGLRKSAPLGRLRWPLLLATFAALGVWLIHASPAPEIDVFLFHRAGFAALLDGHSPYATTIPLLYGDARYYGEGLVRDGIVYIGHPYPPLSFTLTFLAYFLAGDHRYAILLAMLVTAACIAALGSTSTKNAMPHRAERFSELCAVLFLFSPRTFFVLEQGWTEPLVVAFACALALSATRWPRASTWLLGGLLAIKQYGFFALPLLPLLLPRENTKQLVRRALLAIAVALAVTLPLALTAPRAFVDAVLLFQVRQPFRPDSLSFPAALFRAGGPALPGLLSFALLVPALALGWRRAARDTSGFLAALAFAFAVFFDFGKQAFANYHFFVMGLCAAAASAALTRRTSPE